MSRPSGPGPLTLLLVLLALLAAACGGRGDPGFIAPQRRAAVAGVPFHPQEPGQCGPASLAGVLNHYGDPVAPAEIAAAVMREDLGGSTTLDLILYPRGRGFRSLWYAGSAQDLLQRIDAGRPLVVMVDNGLGPVSRNHFMVVTGYGPDGPVVNDGYAQGEVLPWNAFLRAWGRANRWTLLVEPAP